MGRTDDWRQIFRRDSSPFLRLYPVFQRIDAGKENNNNDAGYHKDYHKDTKPLHVLTVHESFLNDALILLIAQSIRLIIKHINISGYVYIWFDVYRLADTLSIA